MTDESKQLSLNIEQPQTDNGPVVCLGMTFKNDDERREYFRNELRKKLPELKKIEGFPIGDDEDIIALSDPPYYTACPNPWINDFIEEWEKEKLLEYGREFEESYHREPFVSDVRDGRSDPVYMAHSYHTKTPHKSIMRFILNYTQPGDIVFDGFSGTGMTGVAAMSCNNQDTIRELGYEVKGNQIYNDNTYISDIGARKSIVSDLSPIASFIGYNYNKPSDKFIFENIANKLLEEVEQNFGWMYETRHYVSKDSYEKALINYVVWSENFICSNCGEEINYWEYAVDLNANIIRKEFNCKNCGVKLTKKELERSYEVKYDKGLNKTIKTVKHTPVFVNYTYKGKRYERPVDKFDLDLIKKIDDYDINNFYPINRMIKGDEARRNDKLGLTHVHLLYPKRNLIVLSYLFNRVSEFKNMSILKSWLTSSMIRTTKMYKFTLNRKMSTISGTYYIPSLWTENSVTKLLRHKLRDFSKLELSEKYLTLISTGSSTNLLIKDNSVDYIFVDPPFGSNLMYSELNFIWESWLKIFTNTNEEAIVSNAQNKKINDYSKLMINCFKEFFRILKPGRWITIQFSNSQSSVWNSIQDSIQRAGFIIANVSVLDKKQGSFKAVTTTTAVKQDLVISAYKPTKDTIEKIAQTKNQEESVWTFVTQHLQKLPVFEGQKGEAKLIAERTPRILFDRMVAYFVQNGLPVSISSGEFQEGVAQRYPMRDGMAFLESQVAEYDKKRTLVKEFTQLSLFVSDENSAIEWIRQQLMNKPQTRQDLHPEFMKQIQHIAKHEELPELDDLLEQNFLRYDGEEPVPNQILTYLRRNYKDLRGLEPTDPKVMEKAMHRWYVPDPNKQSDLEKLREKALLREFNQYKDELEGNKKKLRTFRTEAIRAGFKNAYKEKDFETIVKIGDRIPEKVIQEDDKLFMFYENAKIRLGL
jgi:DNA modification methylase